MGKRRRKRPTLQKLPDWLMLRRDVTSNNGRDLILVEP
jgi:hypothetical protein